MNSYIFDVTPVPKNRQTQRDKWSPSPATLRYRAFADGMRLLANLNKYPYPYALSIDFVIPMPDSWSKKKKAEFLGRPHQQRPDLDNLVKATVDALYPEDSMIYQTHGKKSWGNFGKITITPIV